MCRDERAAHRTDRLLIRPECCASDGVKLGIRSGCRCRWRARRATFVKGPELHGERATYIGAQARLTSGAALHGAYAENPPAI